MLSFKFTRINDPTSQPDGLLVILLWNVTMLYSSIVGTKLDWYELIHIKCALWVKIPEFFNGSKRKREQMLRF